MNSPWHHRYPQYNPPGLTRRLPTSIDRQGCMCVPTVVGKIASRESTDERYRSIDPRPTPDRLELYRIACSWWSCLLSRIIPDYSFGRANSWTPWLSCVSRQGKESKGVVYDSSTDECCVASYSGMTLRLWCLNRTEFYLSDACAPEGISREVTGSGGTTSAVSLD